MSGINFKISRNGYDVKTANDANLAFSSDFFIPKIFKIKKYTSNTTEAHGLDYAPMFFAYRNNEMGAGNTVYTAGGFVSVDDTNVYVTIPGGGTPATEVYVIFFTDRIDG